MEQEIWKDIKGYEGLYQISNLGRVKSFKNNRWGIGKEKILTGKTLKYGYKYIFVDRKNISIHRLVAEAFIPNPENKPQVNHIDGNPSNNKLENLEWCTIRKNMLHKYKMGYKNFFQTNNPYKGKYGINHHRSKPIIQLDMEGNFIKEWGSAGDAHRNLGISYGNISNCCYGLYKQTGGFKWKFKN